MGHSRIGLAIVIGVQCIQAACSWLPTRAFTSDDMGVFMAEQRIERAQLLLQAALQAGARDSAVAARMVMCLFALVDQRQQV